MNMQDIRLHELSTSVESYRTILSLKQKEVDAARKHILRIGQELCNESMQALFSANSETMSLEELASYIIFHAGTRQNNLTDPPETRLQLLGMTRELENLRKQLDFQIHRAQQAEKEISNLKNRIDQERVTRARDKIQGPRELSAIAEPDHEPWFDSW